MKRCALCDSEITEDNDSKEHLIPNAIGGRKKIKGFICNGCNNTSGNDWDSELAKQLNIMSLFLGIRRERGEVPSQNFETTGKDKIKLNADGSMTLDRPIFSEKTLDTEKGIQIQIQARSMNEMKKMLKGVTQKYPQINFEDTLATAKSSSYYSSDMLKFKLQIGGHKAGRSIVKSALALAVESGIPAQSCEHALDYLKNTEAEACFGYFNEKDVIMNRPAGIPLHCVAVKGCHKTQQVLGYVEYFGMQRMVLCLSSIYKGDDVENIYSINPMTGEEIDISINLDLTPGDIRDTYNYKKYSIETAGAALEKVIETGMKASFERERKRVLDDALKYACKKCGVKEGESLAPEDINKFTNFIMEKLEPFIRHHY